MKEELMTFYGAKPSKSGKGWNITLVEGKGEGRNFHYAYVKGEKGREKDGVLWVPVKVLTEKKPEAVTADDLPF